MMSHFNKKTLLIIGVAFVAVAALLFFLFGGQSEAPSDGLSSVEDSPLVDTLGRDLLTLLSRLTTTELNTSLFSDPLFVGLRDFGVAIAPQPVGRRNPFADFGAGVSVLKSGTKAAGGTKAPSAASAKQETVPLDESDVLDFSFE